MQNGDRHLDDDADMWGDDDDAADRRDDSGDDERDDPVVSADEPHRPREWLATLNALRKAGQYHDIILVARGEELPAHRAVLAAAAPALLPALLAADRLRVDAPPDLVRALLDYAYTGRLCADRPAELYAAAWTLRLDGPAERAAAALLRRAGPDEALAAAALPDLPPRARRRLRALLARHAPALARLPALQALPAARLEMRRPPAGDLDDLAAAALAHLRRRLGTRTDRAALEAVCAARHVLEPRDRELADLADAPADPGDPPDVHKYRREAAARDPLPPPPPRRDPPERRPAPRYEVLAVVELGARAALALLHVGEGLVRASITWRGGPAPSAPPTPGGSRLASLSRGRCSFGLAAADGALVAVGGHDSEEVLRCVETYRPETNRWEPGPRLPGPRARCGLVPAPGGGALAAGGSDGQRELDATAVLVGGRWEKGVPLGGRGAAEAALVAGPDATWLVGGEEGGAALRRVLCLRAGADSWAEAAPLAEARAASCCARWGGALWACGGRADWRCLAGVEVLREGAGGWDSGPTLPVARRSAAAAVLRGRLLVVGGADGARSLRRVDVLSACGSRWEPGPELTEARASLGAAVLSGVLFAVGGFSGGAFLSSVECLREPDGCWTSLLEALGPTPPLARSAEDFPMERESA